MGLSHPPQFTPSFVLKKRLRFKAVAAATTTLTARDFGDLWCVAATTTSAYRLASHVRVKKIEMWGPMASDLVPVTISCDWTGSTTAGVYGKSNRVSDTSLGSSEPAHLVTRPPPASQIAQWVSSGTTPSVCILSYPINTIIDVTYELVVYDDGTTAAVTGAVAGATVGANYIRSLDSTSAVNLPPLSYSTI
jgi:hypothetical protein